MPDHADPGERTDLLAALADQSRLRVFAALVLGDTSAEALDQIARVFEPGVRYPERDVNTMLAAFHEDFAALRRYLVDESYLSRADGAYWRTEGTVDVADGG